MKLPRARAPTLRVCTAGQRTCAVIERCAGSPHSVLERLRTGAGWRRSGAPKTRYFFNFHDGQHPLEQDPPDREGTLLADPETARSQAITLAGEMLKDLEGQFWSGDACWLHVTDEERETVCTLRFSGTVVGEQQRGRR